MRLLVQRVGVAEHAGQQPGDRLHDHHHRDLAAEEHVVAERDLGHRHPGRRRRRAPAGRCPRTGRRRRSGVDSAASSCASAWVNGLPGRRRHDQGARGADRVQRLRPTARAASPCRGRRRTGCRRRCGARRGSRSAGRARPARAAPLAARLADQRQVQRGEVLREDRDDVDAHGSEVEQALGQVDDDPAAGQVDLGTIALTNGISAVPPPGLSQHDQVRGGRVVDPGHLAELARRPASTTASPTSWWSWNSSGSSGGVSVGAVDLEQHAAQRLGDVAVVDALERDDAAALVPADRLDDQLAREPGTARPGRRPPPARCSPGGPGGPPW